MDVVYLSAPLILIMDAKDVSNHQLYLEYAAKGVEAAKKGDLIEANRFFTKSIELNDQVSVSHAA